MLLILFLLRDVNQLMETHSINVNKILKQLIFLIIKLLALAKEKKKELNKTYYCKIHLPPIIKTIIFIFAS